MLLACILLPSIRTIQTIEEYDLNNQNFHFFVEKYVI